MIKLLTTALLALVLMTSAQAQTTKVPGIGEYQLGMTTRQFLALPIISARVVETTTADKYEYQYTVIDSNKIIKQSQNYGQNERVIYNANLDFGLYKGNTEFVFWNDRLISIELNDNAGEFDTDFVQVISSRYGKAKVNNQMKTVTCQNGFGAKTTHNDGFIIRDWNNATFTGSIFDCSRSINIFYFVRIPESVTEMNRHINRAVKSQEQEQLNSKRNSSKF